MSKIPVLKEYEVQVLVLLTSFPGKSGTYRDFLGQLEFPDRMNKKNKRGITLMCIRNLLETEMIEKISTRHCNETNKDLNVYTITGKGELFLLTSDPAIPGDYKYPYVMLEGSVLKALRNWKRECWRVPINTGELNGSMHFTYLVKALYGKSLLDIELSDEFEVNVTVTGMREQARNVLDALIGILAQFELVMNRIEVVK